MNREPALQGCTAGLKKRTQVTPPSGKRASNTWRREVRILLCPPQKKKRMKEIWKYIDGYNGKYQVSNIGNVRSFYKSEHGTPLKIMTLERHGLPYRFVSLFFKGKRKTAYIHRLIALSFIPNINKKPCIDHINGNTLDNRIENLRWVTYKENNNNPLTRMKHMYNKRYYNTQIPVREMNVKGEIIANFYSLKDAERKTGIPYQNIKRACEINSHTTHGRYFCY